MADESPVLYEVREGVAIVTLNRPERLNAWNGSLERALYAHLDTAAADDGVKVIVLTGAGRGFCAGADMDVLTGIGERGAEEEPSGASVRKRPYSLLDIPKPVIAAVNGACAGLGMVLALMCDMRFAAANAKFTTAFVRRGLIAEHGMSWILPKLVGPSVAIDLLVSGRVFTGDEAAALGVANRAVPADDLMGVTLMYARDLAVNCSPTSMAVMKREVWRHLLLDVEAATASADEDMKLSLGAGDFVEGVQSFLQKRPPSFTPLSQGWALGARKG